MPVRTQSTLFDAAPCILAEPPKGQLLKWIGNKHRVAARIVGFFPPGFSAYHEPFLGAGAVLATVSPAVGYGSDAFRPLIEIWQALSARPEELKSWYAERWRVAQSGDKVTAYELIKASYNRAPNGADLVFLCRACYGGVVRFRKSDGYMSTPCGAHQPISPDAFGARVDAWQARVRSVEFSLLPYEEAMLRARKGDLVYCDPPYSHSQAILYGAQGFSLPDLLVAIEGCKRRGVFVALSIDGTKKSGEQSCDLPIPSGLFEREVLVSTGRSMLRRFQMGGETLESEHVTDRLLLTY